jgi:hypothetical protein
VLGPRSPFATVACDYLHEGGYGLTEHLVEETTSESDEAAPYDTEFVLEGSFQLGPQCESIGPALFLTRTVRFARRVEGIYPGLLPFGRR